MGALDCYLMDYWVVVPLLWLCGCVFVQLQRDPSANVCHTSKTFLYFLAPLGAIF